MKVLVAAKSVPVLEALRSIPEVEIEAALYTDQIAQSIPTAQLVVIDFDDIVEYPYETGMIRSLLAEAQDKRGLPWVNGEGFMEDPKGWIARASRSRGGRRIPDKLSVAFVSYSGGVGKTTLALDMALHFARRVQRPVLLTEFVYGVSALSALTGANVPHLYDLTSHIDFEPGVFKGVTLIPMDYDNCRLLPPEEYGKYLRKQMARHVLTVVDASWPHGLVQSIREELDQWLVVATPRLDAVENAKKLEPELGAKSAFILNMKRGLGDSMALAGLSADLELPVVDRVDQWEGKLGRSLLSFVYGTAWREYEKSENILAAIGRRLGRGSDMD